MEKKVAIVAVGLLAAWCLYLALFGPKAGIVGNLGAPRLGPPASRTRADYQWTLRDLDDTPVPFDRFKGRTVFLNIWATWCPPCVAELPSIANLADNPRLKDVAFLCVSTDDSPRRVKDFLRDKHWGMTVLRATDLPEAFSTEGIPATFLIAPDGRIAASEVGSARWDDPSVVDFLAGLAQSHP